jgi:hypothetical protein
MRRAQHHTSVQPNKRSRLVRNNNKQLVYDSSDDESHDKENVGTKVTLIKEKTKKAGLSDPTAKKSDLDTNCIICCDTITEIGKIDSCEHSFCLDCIKNWSEQSSTCPVCRKRFRKIKSTGNNSKPIFVQKRDYRHEEDESEIYGIVSRLIAEDEDDEEDDYGSDIDENGNLIGFIDYAEATERRRLPAVFECDDEEYLPSQSSQQHDESEDEEELISTQEHSIISIKSSPSPKKYSPSKKKRKIVIEDDNEDDGYASDRTVILDQEDIFENVIRNLLFKN